MPSADTQNIVLLLKFVEVFIYVYENISVLQHHVGIKWHVLCVLNF